MSRPASCKPMGRERSLETAGHPLRQHPIESWTVGIRIAHRGTRPLMSSSSYDLCPQRLIGPDLFLGKEDFTPTSSREQFRLIAEVR